MRNLPSLVVSAVSTWDGKALAKGQKQIGGFDKGVKNLAKTLGATFGAAAMLSYSKNAVKAFAENEKSAKRLETVLKNLGLAFDTDKIEKNLDIISAKFGYEGEVLREAFQGLITATGSTTKAQDLLNLSLDIAAGSGQDLLTVNRDLAAVYVGNTKGLRKYNLGLAQSELKTLGFDDAVTKLTATFAGAAAAELDTYSGKMRVLREAADNAQETIGGALIDAFMKLAGDTTMDDLTDSVDNLADSLSSVIELAGAVAAPFVGLAKLFNDASMNYTKFLYKVTGTAFMGDKRDRQYGGAAAEKYKATEEAANAKARAKAEAAAAKRQKELLALQKKSALAEKNKLSLSKAAAVFDTNRISIAAALQATYDKETRLRLEALMAIEDDNGDLALRKINELAALQKNADMAKLAGVTQISEATLSALNTQLLTELKVINDSKMAESDKEQARQIAFGKYNAAITAAGELAAKESYSERVQIQLTEIARLASLSKTSNAFLTLNKIRESEELDTIERIAAAQKKADDARLEALKKYLALLAGAGGPSGKDDGAGGAPVYTIPKGTKDFTIDNPTIKKIVENVTSLGTQASTDKFFEAMANGADISSAVRGANYQARAEAEYLASLQKISLTDAAAQSSLMQGLGSGLSLADAASGARYAAQARNYYVTVNAGVISQPDEFTTLIQNTIQDLNRGGDPLSVAGTL